MDKNDPVLQSLAAARIEYDTTNWDPTKKFEDNGIDSLDFMSLLMSVDELFGVKVSDEEASALLTPSDLGQFIAKRRA